MKLKCSFLTVLLLLFFVAVIAQDRDSIHDVNLSLQKSLTQLNDVIFNPNKSVSKSLQKKFTELESKIEYVIACASKAENKGEMDTIFVQSIKHTSEEIARLTQLSDMAAISKGIDLLHEDYDAKVAAIPVGLTETIHTKIKVKVMTKKDNAPLNGYSVHANYIFDRHATGARFIFPQPTNNATYVLAPGRYVIWIEKNNEIKDKKVMSIGISGTPEETIEFLIP